MLSHVEINWEFDSLHHNRLSVDEERGSISCSSACLCIWSGLVRLLIIKAVVFFFQACYCCKKSSNTKTTTMINPVPFQFKHSDKDISGVFKISLLQ